MSSDDEGNDEGRARRARGRGEGDRGVTESDSVATNDRSEETGERRIGFREEREKKEKKGKNESKEERKQNVDLLHPPPLRNRLNPLSDAAECEESENE